MDISQVFTGFILAMGVLHIVYSAVEQYCSHTDYRDMHRFTFKNEKLSACEQRTSLHSDWFVFFNCSSFTLPNQQRDAASRQPSAKHSGKSALQTAQPRIQQRAA